MSKGEQKKFVHSLSNSPSNFRAGKTQWAVKHWLELTSDRQILDTIRGVNIDFENVIDQVSMPPKLHFKPQELAKMSGQIERMKEKGIVEETEPSDGQFISNIFCRPKKDGTVRIILNLKHLNLNVEYYHFKMETLEHVVQLIRPGCFLASIDLKDAYYSIPVAVEDRKFLRFWWEGQLLQFTCLPNGLSEAPRKFTKALKAPFSTLRAQGHDNSAYIDDSCLIGDTFEQCTENVQATALLLDKLGFTIHPEKSIFIPVHQLVYLGFLLDSLTMTVSLTKDKMDRIVTMCKALLRKKRCLIRELAELIGTLVSAQPGVEMGPLFTKRIEHYKDKMLKLCRGSFEAEVKVDTSIKPDLEWWVSNVHSQTRDMQKPKPSKTLTSDSSGFAWGGECDGQTVGGSWSAQERQDHINVKELKAVFLTLKSFCASDEQIHVLLLIDNVTAVSYVNGKGGRKTALNDIARELWIWATERKIWLTATHLPGVHNVQADRASRTFYDTEAEWQLAPEVFEVLNAEFGPFDIDLFATRLNTQCPQFFSWKPDPEAIAFDALIQSWDFKSMYAFPPFSLTGRVLRKVAQEEVQVSIVLPLWTTQFWFGRLLQMTVATPVLLPKDQHTLFLPQDPELIHPLWNRLKLTHFRISGKRSEVKDFQATLPRSSKTPGDRARASSTAHISGDGCHFVVNDRYLHVQQMSRLF